jgi:CDP-diacylglycerol--serine O-phosphatidyltransferase
MTGTAPVRYLHVSNALSYLSLLAGLLAVIAAKDLSSWHLSGALITVSVLLDTFDGRFARLFPRSSDQAVFGMELDSLVDAVVFGFVPVACLYLLLDFGTSAAVRFWWSGAAFIYLVSALTRLGCYNLLQAKEDHFVGMPTTLAALLLSTFALAGISPAVWGFALVCCACAMLAPFALPRPRGPAFVLFISWIILVFTLHVRELLR